MKILKTEKNVLEIWQIGSSILINLAWNHSVVSEKPELTGDGWMMDAFMMTVTIKLSVNTSRWAKIMLTVWLLWLSFFTLQQQVGQCTCIHVCILHVPTNTCDCFSLLKHCRNGAKSLLVHINSKYVTYNNLNTPGKVFFYLFHTWSTILLQFVNYKLTC